MSWREQARCAGRDVDAGLFFGQDDGNGIERISAAQREEARRVCAGCPVREQCLQYAIDSNAQSGIWAGKVFGKDTVANLKRKAEAA